MGESDDGQVEVKLILSELGSQDGILLHWFGRTVCHRGVVHHSGTSWVSGLPRVVDCH